MRVRLASVALALTWGCARPQPEPAAVPEPAAGPEPTFVEVEPAEDPWATASETRLVREGLEITVKARTLHGTLGWSFEARVEYKNPLAEPVALAPAGHLHLHGKISGAGRFRAWTAGCLLPRDEAEVQRLAPGAALHELVSHTESGANAGETLEARIYACGVELPTSGWSYLELAELKLVIDDAGELASVELVPAELPEPELEPARG